MQSNKINWFGHSDDIFITDINLYINKNSIGHSFRRRIFRVFSFLGPFRQFRPIIKMSLSRTKLMNSSQIYANYIEQWYRLK